MQGILTAKNLEKSRQTNAVILYCITREFNDDFTNFASLKLDYFKSLMANNCYAIAIAS